LWGRVGGREVGERWEERGEEGVAGWLAAARCGGGGPLRPELDEKWGGRRMEGRVENLERGGVEINRQKGGEELQK